MRFDILTLFPEMFKPVTETSVFGRAVSSGVIDIRLHDIRSFTNDKHGHTDDAPFGGGAGMVMTCQPLFDAFDHVLSQHAKKKPYCIYMSPAGKTLSQEHVVELSQMENIVILCGHYEGVDQRVLDKYIDEELSVGDYVLTGGEIPAMIVMDSVARYIPGVLGKMDAVAEESFSAGLLEYPQYTRPAEFKGYLVPQILLSGHHAKIAQWRKEKSIEKTLEVRPDLAEKYFNKINKEK